MAYLYYLENLERSPNTLKAYAANLKLYWEFLDDNKLDVCLLYETGMRLGEFLGLLYLFHNVNILLNK